MGGLEFLALAGLVSWIIWRTRTDAQVSIWLRALEVNRLMEIESSSKPREKSEEAKRQEFELAKGLAAHYPFELGVLYACGWGVEKNKEEALRLYREAAEKGDQRAQYNLASAYFDGDGVPRDYETAYFWLKVRELATGLEAVGGLLSREQRAAIDESARTWVRAKKIHGD